MVFVARPHINYFARKPFSFVLCNSLAPRGRGTKGEGIMSESLDAIIAHQAKVFRKDSTEAEKLLWPYLKAKRFRGYKFRRQEPIGKFIADFVCYEKKIIIELDGSPHLEQKERDRERDDWLKANGFRVLRFWNNELQDNLEGVLNIIREQLESPSPNPLP